MKFFAVVLGATFAMSAAACGKKEAGGGGGGGGGESGGGGGDMPASCQKFIDSYKKCIEAMPEAARGPAGDGLKQMQDAWSKAPKEGMEAACKQALDSTKGAMGAACPGVKWD